MAIYRFIVGVLTLTRRHNLIRGHRLVLGGDQSLLSGLQYKGVVQHGLQTA